MGETHWEHGMRCHGLWSGLERVAIIVLTPRLPGHPTVYRWSIGLQKATGETTTLRQAKREVEQALIEPNAR